MIPNHREREIMQRLRGRSWVKAVAIPDSPIIIQRLLSRGWIESQGIVRKKKQRIGRNPKTGERVEVPAKKIPFFKPSKELKDLVNTGGGQAATPPAPPAPPTPTPA